MCHRVPYLHLSLNYGLCPRSVERKRRPACEAPFLQGWSHRISMLSHCKDTENHHLLLAQALSRTHRKWDESFLQLVVTRSKPSLGIKLFGPIESFWVPMNREILDTDIGLSSSVVSLMVLHSLGTGELYSARYRIAIQYYILDCRAWQNCNCGWV